MNSEQVIELSHLRAALAEFDVQIDMSRLSRDEAYLRQVLVDASTHPSPPIYAAARRLGKSLGFSLPTPRDVPTHARFELVNTHADINPLEQRQDSEANAQTSPAPEPTIEPEETASKQPVASEPAALVFFKERKQVLRRYIGGLR